MIPMFRVLASGYSRVIEAIAVAVPRTLGVVGCPPDYQR
jgi:hypothetical protein